MLAPALRGALERLARSAALPLRFCFWDGTTIDLGPAPAVSLTFRPPWTRRHQYQADDPALSPGPLDWSGL